MPHSHIAIIGAPLDLGQGRRGVDMGPSALRVANLNARVASLGYEVEDLGNIRGGTGRGLAGGRPAGQVPAADRGGLRAAWRRRWGSAGARRGAAGAGRRPFRGHRHGRRRLAASSASATESIGLIWLDAHADMNTPESSPSGNVHGMPLACIVGMGPPELSGSARLPPKVAPRNTAIVGLRDVDQTEKPHVRESGVHAFTMRDIDERGLRAVMEEAIRVASDGTAGFHLSLDMDFVDPQDAPGVGTPVRGGATYREAHLAMEMICDSGQMSMEVVEVNPVIDEVNRTADLAVELVMSGLGKRIL